MCSHNHISAIVNIGIQEALSASVYDLPPACGRKKNIINDLEEVFSLPSIHVFTLIYLGCGGKKLSRLRFLFWSIYIWAECRSNIRGTIETTNSEQTNEESTKDEPTNSEPTSNKYQYQNLVAELTLTARAVFLVLHRVSHLVSFEPSLPAEAQLMRFTSAGSVFWWGRGRLLHQ